MYDYISYFFVFCQCNNLSQRRQFRLIWICSSWWMGSENRHCINGRTSILFEQKIKNKMKIKCNLIISISSMKDALKIVSKRQQNEKTIRFYYPRVFSAEYWMYKNWSSALCWWYTSCIIEPVLGVIPLILFFRKIYWNKLITHQKTWKI